MPKTRYWVPEDEEIYQQLKRLQLEEEFRQQPPPPPQPPEEPEWLRRFNEWYSAKRVGQFLTETPAPSWLVGAREKVPEVSMKAFETYYRGIGEQPVPEVTAEMPTLQRQALKARIQAIQEAPAKEVNIKRWQEKTLAPPGTVGSELERLGRGALDIASFLPLGTIVGGVKRIANLRHLAQTGKLDVVWDALKVPERVIFAKNVMGEEAGKLGSKVWKDLLPEEQRALTEGAMKKVVSEVPAVPSVEVPAAMPKPPEPIVSAEVSPISPGKPKFKGFVPREQAMPKPPMPEVPGKGEVPLLPTSNLPPGTAEIPLPSGTMRIPIPEPTTMANYTQKSLAHDIARDKGFLDEKGIPTQVYRQLAKTFTGKRSMAEMTQYEADQFISALSGVVTKGGRAAKISKSKGLVVKEMADRIPTWEELQSGQIPQGKFQEIGFLERHRQAQPVMRKIGVEDFYWKTETANQNFLDDVEKIELNARKAQQLFSADRRAAIMDSLEGDTSVKLSTSEQEAARKLRSFWNDMADRQNLPMEKRRTNYVTHIFDDAITKDLKAKKQIDPDFVRASDFIVPKAANNPFLKARLGKKTGLVKDPFEAAIAYSRYAFKKVHFDLIIQQLRVYEKFMPPNSSKYVRDYINRITGRPTVIDREIMQNLKEFSNAIKDLPGGTKVAESLTQRNAPAIWAHNLVNLQYLGWLGFRIKPAIRNLSQMAMTLAEVGPMSFAKAIGLWQTEEGKELLKLSTTVRSRRRGFFLPGIDEPMTQKILGRIRAVGSYPMQKTDQLNTEISFLSGYQEAISKGLPREWAIRRGEEVAAKTQFMYTKYSSSQFAQSSVGRTLTPLLTYPSNFIELMTDWSLGRPSVTYQAFEKASGQKLNEVSPLLRRKALLTYLGIVGGTYIIKATTPFEAPQYTGWTSFQQMANLFSGELPGLDFYGAVSKIVAGSLTGDTNMIKEGWRTVRPDRWMGIVREIEDTVSGKRDFWQMFIDLNPEEIKTKPTGKWKPRR